MNDRLTRLIEALGNEERFKSDPIWLDAALENIIKNSTDERKSVVNCTYNSVVAAIKKSIELRIPIDNRGMAFLEPRYNKAIGKKEASLGIGYRAYFFKLSKTLNAFDGDAFCIYEGDEIETEDINGFHSYTLKKKDLFASGSDKLKGVIVRLTYLVEGKLRQKLGIVGIEEIMKIRSKAKTKMIWDEWFDEKAKAAAIKRACKGLFDLSQGLQELVEYDNQNFDLDKKEEVNVVDEIDGVTEETKYINDEQEHDIRYWIRATDTNEKDFLEWIGEKSVRQIPADCYEIAIETLKDKYEKTKETD